LRRIAIVGPTATGKTALAVEIARRAAAGELFGSRTGASHGAEVELVSVDAMAVYREMDIGTATPRAAERDCARWHMLDVADPSQEYSVAEFQRDALSALASVAERGNRAVLVGGTGLYHRAVIDGLEIPGRYRDVAAELELTADEPDGVAGLWSRLEVLDPLAASRIEPSNRRRVVRALEVTLGSGQRFSSFGPGLSGYEEPPSPTDLVGLFVERNELDRRLASRLDQQLSDGFLDEVRRLAARAGGLSRTARQAIGYKELLSHVEDGVPLHEALAGTVRRLRAFARRQEAWFRRDPRITWFDATRAEVCDAVCSHLGARSPVGESPR